MCFSTHMEPSANILQVTPFTINSEPTNAWCLSDDLKYTCKLSQAPGVTKPTAPRGGCVRACLRMLLEILTVVISVSVILLRGWFGGLKPKQQTCLGVPGGSSACWAPLAAYTGPLYLYKCTNFSFHISWCQKQLRSFKVGKITGGNFPPTFFFFFFFLSHIWCESQFSWCLGAPPCSCYHGDSLEVNVRWTTSLVRGLLVTIAAKPQLKSCGLNLQD